MTTRLALDGGTGGTEVRSWSPAGGAGAWLLNWLLCAVMVTSTCAVAVRGDDQHERPRARDFGIRIGILPPGPQNAITDVAFVRVGHRTLLEGSDVRTGVTVILPHGQNLFQSKVPAAIAVGNGFGKLVGVTQVRELGVIETPIALTNTLSCFTVADALVRYTLAQPGNEQVRSVNPVVGECNDGVLNDIRGQHIRGRHVQDALGAATEAAPQEGSVGAGTGTRCFGFKGGIGTASRVVPEAAGQYTAGVLVQTNFDGVLNVAGAPVGKALGRHYLRRRPGRQEGRPEDGSCMIVVATDAPLNARQLGRLARRALLGLAATGSPMTHGSGDYVIAFSSSELVRTPHRAAEPVQLKSVLREETLSPLFQAVREATEEAILNSLLRATTMTGFGGQRATAIPLDRLRDVCLRYGVLSAVEDGEP